MYLLSFGPKAFGLVTLERDGQVVNLPLSIFFVSLGVAAAVLLVIGLWRLRKSVLTEKRIARVGLYPCIAPVACIGLTAADTIAAQVQSGRSVDIFFIFLLLGFPLAGVTMPATQPSNIFIEDIESHSSTNHFASSPWNFTWCGGNRLAAWIGGSKDII